MNIRFKQLIASIYFMVLCLPTFAVGNNSNFNHLKRVAGENSGLLIVKSRSDYRLGELIELEVLVPEAGWLNIVEVGPDDKTVVLYPNQYSSNNFISSQGIFRVGSQCRQNTVPDCFKFRAKQPKGTSLVVAVWTRKALNLMDYDDKQNNRRRSLNTGFWSSKTDTLIKKITENVSGDSEFSRLNRSVKLRTEKQGADKIMGYLLIDVL